MEKKFPGSSSVERTEATDKWREGFAAGVDSYYLPPAPTDLELRTKMNAIAHVQEAVRFMLIDEIMSDIARSHSEMSVDAKRYSFWRDCWGNEQFLPTLSRAVASLSTPLKKGDYNNFDIVSDAAMDNGMCKSCVNDKCVTGPECVTLGRDSNVRPTEADPEKERAKARA